jgi:DnaK suppressor protein
MDSERARQLLAAERVRIEEAMSALGREGSLESDDRVEPGDFDSEDLYQDEYNAGRAETLRDQLAAVERAEARLEAGTYGLSIESGEPLPAAERTVEEQGRSGRG